MSARRSNMKVADAGDGRDAEREAAGDRLSHNLLGQRLGRKGRGTRERILAAAERLLATPHDTAISLSAVAREASLGMTTLYLYFADLTELLLAVLDPIMQSAEEAYFARLRRYWPDETLARECLGFVTAFHGFWERHARILHLRNSYATEQDERMLRHRVLSARPIIDLLVVQMDADPADLRSAAAGMAAVLLTGIERLVTIATDADLIDMLMEEPALNVPNVLKAQARLLELAIRDGRAAVPVGTAPA